MPTIRQYFKKSARNVFLIAAAVLISFLSASFIVWAWPTNSPSLKMFFWLYYAKEIGVGIAALTAIFFLRKAYRIYRIEKSFLQELLKMTPSAILWTFVFLYSSTYLYNLLHEVDCQQYNYNDKLNGGIKEIGGRKFVIDICGTGANDSHFFGDGLDRVQLIVADEQGSILARRNYKIMWGDSLGHKPLLINMDSIYYFDDTNSYAEPGTIAMPPTVHDWIGARIPLLNWK